MGSQASYEEIPALIQRGKEFQGNTMSGVKKQIGKAFTTRGRGSMTVPAEADYVIMSYQTPIGYAISSSLFMTTEKFSHTTSRHQSILRELGAIEVDPHARWEFAPYGREAK